jgi:DNA-binding transcriptional regulator YiaG|nr:MAG TPA: Regulatory protein-modification, helix-turn-helix, transcriptional regulator, DNA [Caudoviricetes sp.]
MYSNAELFGMAAKQPKEVFLGDFEGHLDLDAETVRLSHLWDVSRMNVREMVACTGLSQTAFAKQVGIPLRTVQDWCGEKRACPVYLRFLLAEHYGLI